VDHFDPAGLIERIGFPIEITVENMGGGPQMAAVQTDVVIEFNRAIGKKIGGAVSREVVFHVNLHIRKLTAHPDEAFFDQIAAAEVFRQGQKIIADAGAGQGEFRPVDGFHAIVIAAAAAERRDRLVGHDECMDDALGDMVLPHQLDRIMQAQKAGTEVFGGKVDLPVAEQREMGGQGQSGIGGAFDVEQIGGVVQLNPQLYLFGDGSFTDAIQQRLPVGILEQRCGNIYFDRLLFHRTAFSHYINMVDGELLR